MTEPAENKSRLIEITAADLPLHCPMPAMLLWNAHPRVFLPIREHRRGAVSVLWYALHAERRRGRRAPLSNERGCVPRAVPPMNILVRSARPGSAIPSVPAAAATAQAAAPDGTDRLPGTAVDTAARRAHARSAAGHHQSLWPRHTANWPRGGGSARALRSAAYSHALVLAEFVQIGADPVVRRHPAAHRIPRRNALGPAQRSAHAR